MAFAADPAGLRVLERQERVSGKDGGGTVSLPRGGNRIIRDVAATLLVFSSSPTSAENRSKWKRSELGLARPGGTKHLLHRRVAFKSRHVSSPPCFCRAVFSRRYLKTESLEGEGELLITHRNDLV